MEAKEDFVPILHLLGDACGTGPCPSIYKSDDGRYFIQGFLVKDNIKATISLPSNEDLVEISPDLVRVIRDLPTP